MTSYGVQMTPTSEPEIPATQETDGAGIQTPLPTETVKVERQTPSPTETVTLIHQETADPGNPISEKVAPDCMGDEISLIGQSISDEYETASYEQVMTWFCNGAEFEDILVALETEAQTETPPDEMLQMLADDFTWEEIWQLVGLTE